MNSIRVGRGAISILDQTLLPRQVHWLKLASLDDFVGAIRDMRVRGAPLIGVVAAFGLALHAQHSKVASQDELLWEMRRAAHLLSATRPTGGNLSWALKEVLHATASSAGLESARRAAFAAARDLFREDVRVNRAIGSIGSRLIRDGDAILTHCNTGSLATAGYGTALGVIRAAWEGGRRIMVYATETRPLLQGARLTAFELKGLRIPCRLIVDGAAGLLLSNGSITKVIVGADRVLRSGHVFNKIGTYPLAVLAKENGIPFYVASPLSTIDAKARLEDIVLEYRDQGEVLCLEGRRIAPLGVRAVNPAFDVTPPRYVTAIITEAGVAHPPFGRSIRGLLRAKGGS
jgi:methylthioribose-1-phosphate isomerase